jgi:hypothetical protein
MLHSFGKNRIQSAMAVLVLTLLLAQPLTVAVWADSTFGNNWTPRPLVDTAQSPATPAKSTTTTPAQPTPSVSVEQEARLKPYELFISDVEKQLSLQPKAGTSLVNRLNGIQTVLFAGPQYQDAGQLIGKLAELFPKEAAKAQSQMASQSTAPSIESSTDLTSEKARKTVPKAANAAPSQAPVNGNQYQGSSFANSAMASAPSAPAKSRKKHFWNDDWDDPFANDPFFQDTPSNSITGSAYGSNRSVNPVAGVQQAAPSKLKAFGQGLAGLALVAGGLAGSYYLNRNSSRNAYPYGNRYDPSYNSPYGYAPYGYNPYYGNGGYSQNPYGVTYGPYQGTSSISPIGVPYY